MAIFINDANYCNLNEATNSDTQLQKFVKSRLTVLVKRYDSASLNASISDTSYSIELFIWIDGDKHSAEQMADDGDISNKTLDKFYEDVAKYIKQLPDYKKGSINKYHIKFRK
ncbi:hypothetical protein [Bacteroides acidifaciens]|uniref:hypothetical protein n=1 Tax=Bacteroides acidifaciens TaxID=85831 RepID=UPI00263B473F|nr:hypothetical protein [Bacteroides acidifaciens]